MYIQHLKCIYSKSETGFKMFKKKGPTKFELQGMLGFTTYMYMLNVHFSIIIQVIQNINYYTTVLSPNIHYNH